MSATYTADVSSSLDGYGSYDEPGDRGGYWGKQGPELLGHRLASFATPQRMVFGATTFRQFASMPLTVVSSTLEGPLDRPDATVVRGDAVEVVARLEEAGLCRGLTA